jgi:PAS domain-containing protein
VRRHKEGTAIEISLTVSPIVDSQGKVVGISKIARDITARKRMEAALRESEERLRLAAGGARRNLRMEYRDRGEPLDAGVGGPVWLASRQFPGTYAAWEALVHAEDRPEAVRRVKETIKKGGFAGEWRVVWPDGRACWLAGRGRVFKDRFGRPVRLLGVNIDITERKQAEDSLRQSEARFHALIDASAQIVWTSNAQGEMVEDSPSWRAFTGQTVNQWLDGACPTLSIRTTASACSTSGAKPSPTKPSSAPNTGSVT